MGRRKKDVLISQKDRVFLDEFLVKYENFIQYYTKNRISPGVQREDIQQEIRIRLMDPEIIAKLRRMTHNQICAYIYHTAESAFIDLVRKEKRHAHVSIDHILEETLGIEKELVPDLFLDQELRRLRKRLSAREWLALKSKYILGYSQDEIAAQLGVEPDSVRMVLHRARKRALQILAPEKVTGGGGND